MVYVFVCIDNEWEFFFLDELPLGLKALCVQIMCNVSIVSYTELHFTGTFKYAEVHRCNVQLLKSLKCT